MPRRRETKPTEPLSHIRPASTPDGRETQMIELADRLAEKQLRDGTASSQVITHYLKLGSSRERLEQYKLALEAEHVRAKTEAVANQQRTEDLYRDAIIAMRAYSGQGPPPPSDEDYEDYDD